jgi:hypothetical protein
MRSIRTSRGFLDWRSPAGGTDYFFPNSVSINPTNGCDMAHRSGPISRSPRRIHVLRKYGSARIALDHEPSACDEVPLFDAH